MIVLCIAYIYRAFRFVLSVTLTLQDRLYICMYACMCSIHNVHMLLCFACSIYAEANGGK